MKKGMGQYDERALERLSLLMTLHDIGFTSGEVEEYMRLPLSERSTEEERMRMLNQQQRTTLEEIHFREQQLSRLNPLR